ncbi:MAG: metal-dependent hydrolase [Moraxellaceae bacterium]|nr:MAG: metal-dependent hydrolase [Moraxellaceae bacterium]
MNATVATQVAANNSIKANAIKASFPVRRMDFEFNQVPEYWMSGAAGLTHFMTALSALFPDGEKFFVDSVRAVRYHPMLKDNVAMQKEISAFIGQEAMHSKEHVGFNQSANAYGHDVAGLERKTNRVIQSFRKGFAKLLKPVGITQEMIDLTATTALEHFTATIASQLLQNEEIQAKMTDDTMYRLWMWHAVEENEHKAVVYDVFEAIHGRGIKAYGLRTSTMALAMVVLFITQSYFACRLLKRDGQFNAKSLATIYKYAYSPKHGVITGMLPELVDYFRPGFHPNDHDTHALLARWKEKLGFNMH